MILSRYLVPIVVFTLILLSSCSKEDIIEYNTCSDGECSAFLIFPTEKDINGYYHVDLEWDGEFYPRFDVLVDAATTNRDFWYNGSPVVQATFDTNTTWNLQYDVLPVVQRTRIYLSSYSSTRMQAKRIVGPIPPEMKGDTIQIMATVYWEAGQGTKGREIFAKFIVE